MSIGSTEPTLTQPESWNGRTQAFLVLVGVLVLAFTLTLPPLTAEANTVGVSAYCPSSSPGGYFYSKGRCRTSSGMRRRDSPIRSSTTKGSIGELRTGEADSWDTRAPPCGR